MGEYGSPNVDCAFLKALSPADRALIKAAGNVRRFDAGIPIIHEGDPSDHVLIITTGCVKIMSSAAGDIQLILGIRGPDDIVGELAGLDGNPRRATVHTVDRVEALVVPGPRFAQLLSENPAISLALARVLSNRLAEADRYRLAVGSVGVESALARLMLDLATRYGSPTAEGGVTLGVALTQSDLADCLAVSARTVARTIASWRRSGIISTGRRLIVIRRPAALAAIAEP
jgi:CRP-like cAMP-binding protein